MPSIFLAGLALLLAAAALPSQRPEAALRSEISGEALDVKRKPWPGAVVTLVSSSIPFLERREAQDVLTTTTDARGRFRASALRSRRYSVWAMAPTGDAKHGRFRTTRIIDGVTVDDPVRLEELRRRTRTQPARIIGLGDWQHEAPFHVRLVISESALVVPLKLDAGHRTTLPATPDGWCAIRISGKSGISLVSGYIDKRGKIEVSDMEDVFIAVRDSEYKSGIAGATIFSVSGSGAIIPLGTTAKDGVAKLALAVESLEPWSKTYFVSAPGFATAPLDTIEPIGTLRRRLNSMRAGIDASAHCDLARGTDYAGQVLLGGEPVGDLSLLVRGEVAQLLVTDADGRFIAKGLPIGSLHSVAALLSPKHVLQLPTSWHRDVSHRIENLLELHGGEPGRTRPLDPVDLAQLCPVMIEVKEHTGGPAAKVPVAIGRVAALCTAPDTWGFGSRFAGSLTTNRGGRLCALVPTRGNVLLATFAGASVFAKRLAVHTVGGDSSIPSIRVRLPAPWTISGQIVEAGTDPKRPMPGLAVTCRLDEDQGTRDAKAREDEPGAKVTRNVAEFRPLEPRHVLRVMRLVDYRPETRTDKDGRFRLTVPPIPFRWKLGSSIPLDIFGYIRLRKDPHLVGRSAGTVVEVKKPLADLELVFD